MQGYPRKSKIHKQSSNYKSEDSNLKPTKKKTVVCGGCFSKISPAQRASGTSFSLSETDTPLVFPRKENFPSRSAETISQCPYSPAQPRGWGTPLSSGESTLSHASTSAVGGASLVLFSLVFRKSLRRSSCWWCNKLGIDGGDGWKLSFGRCRSHQLSPAGAKPTDCSAQGCQQ